MSYARTMVKGVTFHDSRKAYNGFTLFSPMEGKDSWLIDMRGRLVNHWEVNYKPGCDAQLLPNGHLLYAGKVEDGPMADMEGSGGILLEVDWDGKTVWKYEDPYLHHTFYRRKNGNTLVLKWVETPKTFAAAVNGGDPGSERDGVMWGDVIQEITPEGKIAWEWIAHKHLGADSPKRCLLCPRDTWIHTNGIAEMHDGSIVASFAKINTVAIIDKRTGDIKWQWGAGTLAHQHGPVVIDGGNILIFDNGMHPDGFAYGYSRVIEMNPKTTSISWSYGGAEETTIFYSSLLGNCQRLPNGNTLVCEGTTGRIFEVNIKRELVWEFVNNFPMYQPYPAQTRSNMICTAYRYGCEYSGLKEPCLVSLEKEPAPSFESKEQESMTARLWGLGY